MAVIGTLSSVNLIAGAGILGNIGGVPIAANSNLSNSINGYSSVNVVNQFAAVAATGYVTVNIVANTFPALTNAIPTAYQGNLGSSSLTGTINSQSSTILGNGDLGKFEQILFLSSGYVTTTNQFIKSTLNAANSSGYVSQDNTITGGFSDLTLAFRALSEDLARLGNLINLENLNNLGSPNALLEQISSLSSSLPGITQQLIQVGLTEDTIDNIGIVALTDAEQKLVYQAMTQITGNELTEILKLLRVTTPGIKSLADLLNPVKIFPNSFLTFTAPTRNGLRGVYLDQSGTVNSNLETQLPDSVLRPLQGNQQNVMTYDRLRKIIPSDQALANKAVQAALEQVKTIFNSNLPLLAGATRGLETNRGLNLINALTEPLPQAVIDFYLENFNNGTGPDGLLLLCDVIGTPTGWVHTANIQNTTNVLSSMQASDVFLPLTNAVSGIYTVMANTASGVYTTGSEVDPGPPPVFSYTTTIPGGFPGAGSYTANTAGESIQLAFTNGLNPAMVSAVNTIVSNNANSVNQTNANWANICVQLEREDNNLLEANVDFANLQANVQPLSLVQSLPSFGLETQQGGPAYYIESVAVTTTLGGQAIVSTMREARNQARLNSAGIQTDIVVSEEYPEPQTNLSDAQYTTTQAIDQKII